MKVEKQINIKEYMQTNDYKMKNDSLNKWINRDKISIDRYCFKKTKEEKELSKQFKSEYKKKQKNENKKTNKTGQKV